MSFDLKNYDLDGKRDTRIAARGIARRDNKFLVVTGHNGAFRFPGGGVEEGESLVDAMCREVREESGHTIRKDSAKEYAVVRERRKGLISDILEMDSYYFLCEVQGTAGAQALDAGEVEDGLRPVWVDLEEALTINRRRLENADGKATPRIIREIKVMERLLEDGGQL